MLMSCFGDLTELMLDYFWDSSKWTNGSSNSVEWFGKQLGKTWCNSSILYGADKCLVAFVPRIEYFKFWGLRRNGTVTEIWLSLFRKISTSTHPSQGSFLWTSHLTWKILLSRICLISLIFKYANFFLTHLLLITLILSLGIT